MSKMIEADRERLENECLRYAKKVAGCEARERITIKRADEGQGPNWYVEKFVPDLPHDIETNARKALIKLTGEYRLVAAEKN